MVAVRRGGRAKVGATWVEGVASPAVKNPKIPFTSSERSSLFLLQSRGYRYSRKTISGCIRREREYPMSATAFGFAACIAELSSTCVPTASSHLSTP